MPEGSTVAVAGSGVLVAASGLAEAQLLREAAGCVREARAVIEGCSVAVPLAGEGETRGEVVGLL